MIDVKKLILLILKSFGISGLLSTIGIVLIALNWNHDFVIKDYDVNNLVNSLLITLLVVYCIFILIFTRGKYAETIVEKIKPLANTENVEKIEVEEEIVRPRLPSNKIEVKKPRRNSVVKINEDGTVEIEILN